jgi:DNA-binding CsgD family transcriptional regulator
MAVAATFAVTEGARVNVCGLSILTRKNLVMRRFGADAWSQFYRDVAQRHGCFRSLVTAETPVPLPAFLAFHDELVRRFFKEDVASYVRLGRESSRWAVRDGPLKSLVDGSDLTTVVASLPKFHAAYFKEAATWSEASITSDGVEFKVHELPESHPYFEHFIVGYVAEILELFCANPIRALRLAGGGKQYHYLLHGAPAEDAPQSAAAKASPGEPQKTSRLSSREVEVLSLVALGRTNVEIGVALGISKKTVQHHVTHTYRKLGVSSRVEAAMWLIEHGIIRS